MWRWNSVLALTPILCVVQASHAEGKVGEDVLVAAPGNDDNNYEGDRIWFYSAHKVWRRDIDGNLTEACVQPGQPMLGRRKSSRVVQKNGADETTQGWLFDAVENRISKANGICPEKYKANQVAVGESVFVPDTDLQAADRARVGWTFGALVVPYKYQLRGDKEFSPSASLGGYIGWRFERTQPLSVKVVAFAGASMVPVAVRDSTGKPTDQISNHAAFSAGIGFLGTLKSAFNIGLVIGADHTGKSVNYINQNKPWVAFSLGYDFAN